MSLPERLDLWVANLGYGPHDSLKFGTRPVLVLSNTDDNRFRDTIIVMPLKSHRGENMTPRHMLVDGGGLQHPSVVSFGMIQTIPKDWLREKLGVLPEPYRDKLELKLMENLGLGDRIPWENRVVPKASKSQGWAK